MHPSGRPLHRLRIGLSFLVLLGAARLAGAQYFGQSKVQYKTYPFEVLKTEHFDIYFYPEEREAAEHAARMAERWNARLSKLLHHRLSSRQPVILYGSHPDFEQTNTLEGALGEGTGGVTEALKRRVIIPFAGPLAETDHVLGHELVHAFQYDIGGFGRGSYNSPVERLPLWFIEGMAEYLSVGPADPHTAMWMREAAQRGKLPRVKALDRSRFFPYRYGQALWAYIGGRWGDEKIGEILKQAARGGDAIRAIEKTVDVKEERLSKDWQESIDASYKQAAAADKPASEYGRPLITEKASGHLNLGPALSPDGRYLAFLSEKGLFSIELYLADTKTGHIVRKLTSTAVDPHYDSLQFINSAGAWDASGKRFAFAGISKGRPIVTIVDMPSGHVSQELTFDRLDEVFHPTWSPDGAKLAFTGQHGGVDDLYVYDLAAQTLRALTQDAFADLEPAWSPDGKTIAFVTDRFSSDLATERFGNYRLAAIDVASGDIRALPSFPDAKNVDPQWSRSGKDLFFISDHGGISNIFRIDPTAQEMYAVTNLVLGASGITAISPALSVAAGADSLAFSAYEAEGYRIYVVDAPQTLAGTRVEAGTEAAALGILPPADRQDSLVADMLRDDKVGLAERDTFSHSIYHSKLTLDYVAQPYLAVGADRFGTFVGGGTSLFFSDMLGDHSLELGVQGNGRFHSISDFSAFVGYENRRSRLNWGVIAEQIPLDTAGFTVAQSTVGAEPVEVDNTILFRETHRLVGAVVSYPFSRAERLEMQADLRHISFSAQSTQDIFSLLTGDQLSQSQQNLPSAAGLTLGELTAAFVHDTSLFGATSPILGRRYRFEISPTVGTLHYTGVLADYRAYFMPVRPVTVAFRALHYGRYGSGGEDTRLTPLFLGYSNLIRGYDVGSFRASECGTGASCPVFDQLFGSKLAVGNAEVRFPLLGIFGAKNFYGPLPIEGALFADTGVAWTSTADAKFLGGGGTRGFVSSVGAAIRVNVLGLLIAEIDYVRPLDRPLKGWSWQFNLTPGF
jgi:Tol biopolymer transport system component